MAYGDPRTARNLDLVIAIEASEVTTLVTALEAAGFYCPPLAVEAVKSGREIRAKAIGLEEDVDRALQALGLAPI